MKKLTNTIGSFIVAIIIIAFPVIVGIGMNSDWLDREGGEGVLIQIDVDLFADDIADDRKNDD